MKMTNSNNTVDVRAGDVSQVEEMNTLIGYKSALLIWGSLLVLGFGIGVTSVRKIKKPPYIKTCTNKPTLQNTIVYRNNSLTGVDVVKFNGMEENMYELKEKEEIDPKEIRRLAVRAIGYATIYATGGFGLVVGAILWGLGVREVKDIGRLAKTNNSSVCLEEDLKDLEDMF